MDVLRCPEPHPQSHIYPRLLVKGEELFLVPLYWGENKTHVVFGEPCCVLFTERSSLMYIDFSDEFEDYVSIL